MEISSAQPYAKKYTRVNGRQMAYVECGTGDPIVFLHGNPTSSYLWRNITPYAEKHGRCIAPDLIGMGDSEKLDPSGPDRYRFVEHREYLDGLLAALGVRERVTFVLHDWGSALGFDWANRHRAAVRGIAYMEAVVHPMRWEDWPYTDIFKLMRADAGEEIVLQKNIFVERILPGSILRKLTDAEMAEYRRPFIEPGEGRRPTLTWPRQIPLGGEPADVVAIAADYAAWLPKSPFPKLLISAEPGGILVGPHLAFCRTWPNQTEVTVKGSHFIQEDSPHEIGAALEQFLLGLNQQVQS
ncbi:MAG: haloalkane dehalogenase [Alphaproteobacteria bacterium]|nr:haloalkane dehalogenase [Alphaproteobacteria bacterium]